MIGHAGELHPRVVADPRPPARACALELDLGALLSAAMAPPVLPPLSPYPPADRDVALLVPAGVSAPMCRRHCARVPVKTWKGFGCSTTSPPLMGSVRWPTGCGGAPAARSLRRRSMRSATRAVAEAVARTGARQRA